MLNFFFSTGARRRPDGWLGKIIKAYAAATSAWVIYAAAFSREDALTLIMTFFALMLVLTFQLAWLMRRRSSHPIRWEQRKHSSIKPILWLKPLLVCVLSISTLRMNGW